MFKNAKKKMNVKNRKLLFYVMCFILIIALC